MENNIINSLNWRYAVKEFDTNKKVSNEDLNTLLEAINLTPTSIGLQMYKVVVVESQDLKEKLKEASYNQAQLTTCSHVLVFCTLNVPSDDYVNQYINYMAQVRSLNPDNLQGYKEMSLSFMNGMSKTDLEEWKARQTYIALGNLMTTAAEMRIDACPMEGFIPTEYNRILGLDNLNLNAVVTAPIGYRSENDALQFAKKVRKPLNDLVINL